MINECNNLKNKLRGYIDSNCFCHNLIQHRWRDKKNYVQSIEEHNNKAKKFRIDGVPIFFCGYYCISKFIDSVFNTLKNKYPNYEYFDVDIKKDKNNKFPINITMNIYDANDNLVKTIVTKDLKTEEFMEVYEEMIPDRPKPGVPYGG